MGDTLTPQQRSERMARVRSGNTKPEMVVRRVLHGLGYRYRLHAPELPGKPDIVFRKRRKVIFVHGCFWHRHSDPACRLARLPKSRQNFWIPKLEANRRRDGSIMEQLQHQGWDVLLVWECRIGNMEQLENELSMFLDG